jgi:dUTP pyrophosphatase
MTEVTIPFKKLSEKAKIPTQATPSDAGYDLYTTESYTLKPGERKLLKTNISTAIPHGYYGRIAPRSGLAYKHGIDVLA